MAVEPCAETPPGDATAEVRSVTVDDAEARHDAPRASEAPSQTAAAAAEASRPAAQPAPPPAGKQPSEPLVALGAVIQGRWEVMRKLGQGAFGETYAAAEIPRAPDEAAEWGQVAVKVERLGGFKVGGVCRKADVLRGEVVALRKCQRDRIVHYICHGQDLGLGINYCVMQRLGPNLTELRRRAPRQTFELGTIVRLGLDMLAAIEQVHKCGFLHRDIKPTNYVVGACRCSGQLDADSGRVGCDNPACLCTRAFLIDFGLARRHVEDGGGLRPARKKPGFRGTARYASVHSHAQLELSPRDDLWPLFYSLVEFVHPRGLPWRTMTDKDLIWEEKLRELREEDGTLRTLSSPSPSQLFVYYASPARPRLPQLSDFMEHLAGLEFSSTPDYKLLRRLLAEVGSEHAGLSPDAPLPPIEWQRPGWGQHTQHDGAARAAAPPSPPAEHSPAFAVTSAAAADEDACGAPGAPAAADAASAEDVKLVERDPLFTPPLPPAGPPAAAAGAVVAAAVAVRGLGPQQWRGTADDSPAPVPHPAPRPPVGIRKPAPLDLQLPATRTRPGPKPPVIPRTNSELALADAEAVLAAAAEVISNQTSKTTQLPRLTADPPPPKPSPPPEPQRPQKQGCGCCAVM
eukprot:TRINITY_DN6380_c0_g1_i2.p1 TRINITY_DN6380_c0_g1~~TRINITY_DN6380_c0_g1_i2.p1  ORF type:complete len:652 (+),score=189.82 TRINITY_DN6380_c0_g1_i2:69-1958(+)